MPKCVEDHAASFTQVSCVQILNALARCHAIFARFHTMPVWIEETVDENMSRRGPLRVAG